MVSDPSQDPKNTEESYRQIWDMNGKFESWLNP